MKEKRLYNFLIFACAFLWIMMMGSKNVYTAEIVELQNIFNAGKSEIMLAMTYYFITYSSAQMILFFFMDDINVKWFMAISIFLSGIVTVLVAFMTSLWQTWWLLALNGVLQAGVWGLCLAVLKKYLPNNMIPKANTIMNVGMTVASVISYGSAAISVAIKNWSLPFIVLGVILSISAIIFFIAVRFCEKNLPTRQDLPVKQTFDSEQILPIRSKRSKIIFFIISFIFSLFIHSVFYGTMNWMPNLLTENYGVKESIGILISVFAPIATIIGPIFAIKHCEKTPNFIKVCIIYLLVSTLLSLFLIFVFNSNIILATLILVIYIVFMQATVTIIFSVLPFKIGAGINTGALASLMNAAGGYSAGLAPMILGKVIELNGWQTYFIIIFIITFLLFLGALPILKITKKAK